MRAVFALLLACLPLAPTYADDGIPTAKTIIERVYAAAGGETWRRPLTLYLGGYGIFYPDGTEAGRKINERHEMYRVYPQASPLAHVANGKVRINSWRGGKILFENAFDGVQTYTQAGPTGTAGDSREWKENFGFGIIRYALDPGMTLTRLPDDSVEGRATYTIRVSDTGEGTTLFSIDKENYRVLKIGFATPKGWHERLYSEFIDQSSPRWVQPMRVRLYYNGIKQNEIVWQKFEVNKPIADAVFVIAKP